MSFIFLIACLILYNHGVPVTGRQQCTDRFMELDLIKYRAGQTGPGTGINTRLNNEIRVLTEYQFNCSSTNITSVILGIDFRLPTGSRRQYPSIQLYRPGSGNVEIGETDYTLIDKRVIYYSTSNVSTSGVSEYPLDPPITANIGDLLAVYQPNDGNSIVRVYYIEGMNFASIKFPSTLKRRRRMTSSITSIDNQLVLVYPVTDGNCVSSSNSITDSTIRQNALKVAGTDDINERSQYIYPEMKFSCNGTITKWIYGGKEGSGSRLPELQIWRQMDTNNYMKVNSSLVDVSTPNDTNVYEFIPQSPLKFQEGDIFGVHIPRDSRSKLRLSEQRESGPINLRVSVDLDSPPTFITSTILQTDGNDFPLVTAEISIITPSVTISTTNSIETTTARSEYISGTSSSTTAISTTDGLSTNTHTMITAQTPDINSNAVTPSTVITSINAVTSSSLNASTSPPLLLIVVPVAIVLILLISVVIVIIIVVSVIVGYRKKCSRSSSKNISSLDKEVMISNQVYQSQLPVTVNGNGGAVGVHYEALPSAGAAPQLVYDEVQNEVELNAHNIHLPSVVKAVDNVLYGEHNFQSSAKNGKDVNKCNHYEVSNDTEEFYSALNHFPSPPPDEFFVEEQLYWEPGSNTNSIYQQLSDRKYREITRQKIQINKHLGSGQFGTVDKGVWYAPWGSMEVAVKTLNDETAEEEKVLFLREAAIMGQFHHPNIVKMHGVVTVGEPIMIVLELMTQGDLRQYLQQYQPIPGELVAATLPSLLLEFSKHVCSGMDYLSNKNFVHRDLAARNILVTDKGNHKGICKIADFGMSRDLQDENYYISHAKKIPIKWTAPEALHFKRYSTASDVWSYGAVLYEIWSVGHKPFENYSNQECVRLVDSGYRLPPPAGCPRLIYQLMIQCWNPDTSGRPSFNDILIDLNQLDMSQCNTGGLGGPVDSSLYADLQNTYYNKE